jgi:hypothetical protein
VWLNAGCLPAFASANPVKQPFVAVFPMSLSDFAPEMSGFPLEQSHSALEQTGSATGQTGSAPWQSHFPPGESRSFPGENRAFWHTRYSPGGFMKRHRDTGMADTGNITDCCPVKAIK